MFSVVDLQLPNEH